MTAPAKYLSSEIQMRLKRFRFSLAVAAVLLTIVGATGFGNEHNEFYTNFIFYSTLLLFFIYYLLMSERPRYRKYSSFSLRNSSVLFANGYLYSSADLPLYSIVNLFAAKPSKTRKYPVHSGNDILI